MNNNEKINDLRGTVTPKSDQLNFEDVQSSSITAVIKSIRAGNSEQPVFIDLIGYDGRPYKPSKSMRRVLIAGWGSDGHSWVGKSLTLIGDANVKFGGVAVGGIKVSAMSHIDADFSLMLTTSRGKRTEHRVKRLSPDPLTWFTANAGQMDMSKLQTAYDRARNSLNGNDDQLKKLEEVYSLRKSELQ
ncbi:hypothetical protein [Pantoea sp. BAV 3049]|uniref:hypothetical protein n=1 Tax=Pantoea sp. BAV 3049 TaxID=2654188 RepID=UPI00131DF7B7|nr:hypothetical protein [Pantoea sp. BAV 3049]